MREIKFKVWDKISCRWNEDGKDYTKKSNVYAFDTEGTSLSMLIDFINGLDRYILCQYTGLLDKNGKEIYEGDIVKCEGITALVKYVVEPAIAGFVFDQDNCGAYREYAVDENDKTIHYEVIGNNYENPELLKVKKETK